MSFAKELKGYILRAGGVTKEELRKIFGRSRAIEAMLSYGRKTGQIIEKDGRIYFQPREFKADRVYRAARILKAFTTRDIALYTGLGTRYVSAVITDLEKTGYIQRAGRRQEDRRQVLWVLVKDDPERPSLKGGRYYVYRQNKKGNARKDTHRKKRARAR